MLRNSILLLLVFLVAATPNGGLAAIMTLGVADTELQSAEMTAGTAVHMVHGVHSGPHHPPMADSSLAHEHDGANCEEHCLSCINHCSTTAIDSSSWHGLGPDQLHTRGLHDGLLHRAYLLFRPPIHD